MYVINKIRADHVIDFAAEELKKYLRMMMPECNEVDIVYDPSADYGFRLGLLSDFGIDISEAEDLSLDDIVHVDTNLNGGIIAGSNPRSVLFSVYKFLYANGCRWLYPGIDGEYIPVTDISPVNYHKMADHRFRGHCNEGAESQQCMIETIDYYAKLGINVYMIEFDVPYAYYDHYYSHECNSANRIPEPVDRRTVLQWKRQCETEISKRGLQFHDMGHGWTAEPFGIDSTSFWRGVKLDLSEQIKQYLAKLNGTRALYNDKPLHTNVCMSNPVVRDKISDCVVNYAKNHKNVDYIHVWLADSSNNHCECDECIKKLPSDWYIMIMNEIDEKLTANGLDSKITFIAYVDTLWAPQTERIKNPHRFSLLYAPISHTYSMSTSKIGTPVPYVRNKLNLPKSIEENNAYLTEWKKIWNGPCFSYEYHFWVHQYYDPGTIYFSKRVYEDIHTLKELGLDGYVEDGSQRSFFPNGLSMYMYANALFDLSLSYEDIKDDYMMHAYGRHAKWVEKYLSGISDLFDFTYLSGEYPDKFYAPQKYESLKSIHGVVEKGREYILKNLNMPYRAQTVSMHLLLYHVDYCKYIADFIAEKSIGNDDRAEEIISQFLADIGRYEADIERYFDQYMCWRAFKRAFRHKKADLTQA